MSVGIGNVSLSRLKQFTLHLFCLQTEDVVPAKPAGVATTRMY